MAVACAGGEGPHQCCRARDAGHVRINGTRETAPGHALKLGDVVTIGLDRSVRVLRVIAFAERRGDAIAARVLYEDLQDGHNDYLGQATARENAFRGRAGSLAAAVFLR